MKNCKEQMSNKLTMRNNPFNQFRFVDRAVCSVDTLCESICQCLKCGNVFIKYPVPRRHNFFSGKVIDKNERTAFFRTFCKKTAFAVTGQFRRIFCIVFVQSVVFFISQIFVFRLHKENIA